LSIVVEDQLAYIETPAVVSSLLCLKDPARVWKNENLKKLGAVFFRILAFHKRKPPPNN